MTVRFASNADDACQAMSRAWIFYFPGRPFNFV